MPTTEQGHIVVIGAANADITGISTRALKLNESNPGKISLGAGGVGRNIADNFARLAGDNGVKTYMLTAVGDDYHGKMLIEQSAKAGIDMSHVQTLPNHPTASYFCIIDNQGEMSSAINDMSIVEQINVEYLTSHAALINSAQLIIFDANLSQAAIDYICQNFNHVPIYADTVSVAKAKKILPNLAYIQCLTPNLNEAETLSGISIDGNEGLAKTAAFFHNAGVSRLFITMGANGLYASAQTDNVITAHHLPAFKGHAVNTNGAGDTLMAGLIFAFLQGQDINQQASFAQACAFHNTQSNQTINKNLSHRAINHLMETLK